MKTMQLDITVNVLLLLLFGSWQICTMLCTFILSERDCGSLPPLLTVSLPWQPCNVLTCGRAYIYIYSMKHYRHNSVHPQSFGIKTGLLCISFEPVVNKLYITAGYQMAVSQWVAVPSLPPPLSAWQPRRTDSWLNMCHVCMAEKKKNEYFKHDSKHNTTDYWGQISEFNVQALN